MTSSILPLALQAGQFATAAIAGRIADARAATVVLDSAQTAPSLVLYSLDTDAHDSYVALNEFLPRGSLVLIDVERPGRWDHGPVCSHSFGTLSEDTEPGPFFTDANPDSPEESVALSGLSRTELARRLAVRPAPFYVYEDAVYDDDGYEERIIRLARYSPSTAPSGLAPRILRHGVASGFVLGAVNALAWAGLSGGHLSSAAALTASSIAGAAGVRVSRSAAGTFRGFAASTAAGLTVYNGLMAAFSVFPWPAALALAAAALAFEHIAGKKAAAPLPEAKLLP